MWGVGERSRRRTKEGGSKEERGEERTEQGLKETWK